MHRVRMIAFGLLAAGLIAGCGGGPKLARVSGVVKMDGKPCANVLVSFQPLGSEGNENPGEGSIGRTDENGRFSFTELRSGFLEYLPIGLVIGGIFLFELLLTVGFWVINPGVAKSITAAIPTNISNTEALGLVLYTRYIHYFQLAGMVLLVAMIGAIVLTLRHKANVKRQDINVQNARTPELAMTVRKVASGQGLQDADAAEWVR